MTNYTDAVFTIERLQLTVDVLTNLELQPGQFDMTWYGGIGTCGITACPVGWTAQDPRAHALGFQLVVVDGKHAGTKRLTPQLDPKIPGAPYPQGWLAAAYFYGISKATFDWLFTEEGYTYRPLAEVGAKITVDSYGIPSSYVIDVEVVDDYRNITVDHVVSRCKELIKALQTIQDDDRFDACI